MMLSFRRLLPGKAVALGVTMVVTCAGAVSLGATDARANDFFSNLFGGFLGHPQASRPLSYAPGEWRDPQDVQQPQRQIASRGSRQAFCVRTCDGRYFPVQTGNGQSSAASCNSFCPASETKVFYGSAIDHAVGDGGKSYSALPNAFKYRSEIVPGCTCNGKNQFGLAKVDINHDPTVRKGDFVAGPDGLMMAAKGADKRGASLQLSPAPESVRARFERMPVVASSD
jgi:hypothetical protein